MASTMRAIDKLPKVEKRPVEMQVLCLGLSRTSTMSLLTALNKLGYKTYHATEATRNRQCTQWNESLEAKISGNGEVFGREEFDKLLGSYSAVTDMPCANFPDELIAAYPDAKVILTTRDPDKWIASVESSFYRILGSRTWLVIPYLLPQGLVFRKMLLLGLTDWASGHPYDRTALRAGFIAHNEHVRGIVPKEKLLEFTPKDGWKPLCEFLGKEVPDEPFPHVNAGSNAYKLYMVGLTIGIIKAHILWVLGVSGLWMAYKWAR